MQKMLNFATATLILFAIVVFLILEFSQTPDTPTRQNLVIAQVDTVDTAYDPYALDIIDTKSDAEVQKMLQDLETLSRSYSQTGMPQAATELDSIRGRIIDHVSSRRSGFTVWGE